MQRFNATLGCFVHFHVVAPDGVFTRTEAGAVTFHAGRAPSREDIDAVAGRVAARMTKWLRRRKLLDERPEEEPSASLEERGNEAPELSPLEACMQLSLFGGIFMRLGKPANDTEEDAHRRGAKGPWVAEQDGFNVHAGVVVQAGDREGLERLCRYGARPPFSLERLAILPDGRIAYLLRKPRKNGATHLVMTPVQFLARIAAIIPPPRFPLLRFAGVLAPSSSWRPAVVAMCPPPASGATEPPAAKAKKKRKKKRAEPDAEAPPPAGDQTPPARTSLGAGVIAPCYARIDWATLLRRIYLDDVLSCPCGGRRYIVEEINEPDAIVSVLTRLGLDPATPTLARARDPTDDPA